MNISRSVSYAIAILLKIGQEGKGGSMTAAQIAKGGKFPPRFLYRVLRRLVDAGLLRGVSGPGGGYALARQPKQIHMLDVVTAIEGERESNQLTAVHPRHRKAIDRVNAQIERDQAVCDRGLKRMTLATLLRG
jgi:Rrf2 family protein